jgi:hypothetical protein
MKEWLMYSLQRNPERTRPSAVSPAWSLTRKTCRLPLVRRELAGGSDLAEIGDAAGCVCGEGGEVRHGGWPDNSSVGVALDG